MTVESSVGENFIKAMTGIPVYVSSTVPTDEVWVFVDAEHEDKVIKSIEKINTLVLDSPIGTAEDLRGRKIKWFNLSMPKFLDLKEVTL